MKKSIIFIALVTLFIPSVVLATAWQEEITVAKNQVVDRNFIKAARTITISGEVEGDVIVAASQVTISGKVGGDVIAAGSDIEISGEVAGNVRVAGANINISGLVGKNLNAFGSQITLSEDSQVAWSVMAYGANVDLKGIIGGHLDGGGDTVNVYGQVGGDANIHLAEKGQITIRDDAEITGTLIYKSNSQNQLTVESAATIGSQQFQTWEAPELNWKALIGWGAGFYAFSKLVALFGLYLVGLVLIALFGRRLLKITEIMVSKPLPLLGWGLVYLIVTPLVLIILLIMVISAPLAVIGALLYGIILYLTKIFVGLWLGAKILKYFSKGKEISLIWSLVIGVLIYSMLINIPGLGWFISLIGTIWVLGAIASLVKQLNWSKA
ncbi:polymer-forming cytoskeletal protein [Patescibacteria group bacterium]|nr:polymer-forming cytoskeletal protein [Patescibacteria group bacterium]